MSISKSKLEYVSSPAPKILFQTPDLQLFASSSEECGIVSTEYWLHRSCFSHISPPVYITDANGSLPFWDAWDHTWVQHQGLRYFLGRQGDKAEM